MKDIVFLNMSWYREWQDGVVNRNRCIVEEVLKREDVRSVLCVDFIPFTWKMVIKSFLKEAKPPLPEKLTVYHDIRGFFSEKWFIDTLVTHLKMRGMNHPVLWSYNPMFVSVFAQSFWEKKIFDAVDNWTTHPSYVRYRHRLEENYQRIEHHADTIFLVSPQQKIMFPHHTQVLWVPNGVDVSHFSVVPEKKEDILQKIAKIKSIPESLKQAPIIGYVGTIQERVDLSLLREVIQACPGYLFLFVGPIWPSVQKEVQETLQSLPNAFFVGRVPYQQTSSWIHAFDVGMIAHKMDAFLPNTNSMKMYEYMACGKPTVSTPGSGVEEYPQTITVARNVSEFVQGLSQGLVLGKQESFHQACRAILSGCTWQVRVQEMMKYL